MRSNATDDILRTPLSKIDPSLFSVPQRKDESVGAGKLVFAPGVQLTEPESSRKTITINELVDAGLNYDPALRGWFSLSRFSDSLMQLKENRPWINYLVSMDCLYFCVYLS